MLSLTKKKFVDGPTAALATSCSRVLLLTVQQVQSQHHNCSSLIDVPLFFILFYFLLKPVHQL